MERARTTVQFIAVSVLAAVCIYAVYELFHPPFSDQEIKASVVDTWEVGALSTVALIIGIAIVGMTSLALRIGTVDQSVRRLSVIAVILSIASIAILFYSHIALTERTTQLTGQTFGRFYGLF